MYHPQIGLIKIAKNGISSAKLDLPFYSNNDGDHALNGSKQVELAYPAAISLDKLVQPSYTLYTQIRPKAMLRACLKHFDLRAVTLITQQLLRLIDRREDNGLDMCEKVMWQQVLSMVRCLRRGKAPGPDGILNEMIVYGGFRVMETLAQLMNLAITEEYAPSEWRYVMPLYKSGDPEVACNYRGIALGSCVAKVFTRVLTRRLGEYAEERILTEAQGGFQAKRSCSDQILTLRGICELRRRK